ncbi:MAG: gp16 family protein [Pseudorhodobacter sp.]
MTAARSLQRLIHVGCKQLGIDQETRRDLQLMLTGKASLADMDELELTAMVEGLKARGFETGFKGASKGRRPAAPRGDLRYLHVLWRLLGEAGAVKVPGRAGLNAFVRSQFEGKWKSVPIDIDALRDAGQINDVMQALKAMCRRSGVRTER